MPAQPLVSIVTPVYNGAEYLVQCIESILAQTYPKWDYTVVDNCSTDASLEIARRYAARDPRIRVHKNQKFLRAIPNHNAALRLISPDSRYCKVVFADDWIFPECLAKMVAVAQETPSVGLVSAYCLEGRNVICTGLDYPSTIVSGREICRRHLLEKLHLFGSANTVLYRADLVRSRDPFLNEANIHADTEVCFALLKECDFGFIHQVLTFTRLRPGSLNTISTDMQTPFSGMLHVLAKYGPEYLTADEASLCWRQHLSEYYRFLAKSLFLGRDREFWQYHRKQLNELGPGFSAVRLARSVADSLLDVVLNPLDSLKKLVRRRHRRSLDQDSNRLTSPAASPG